MSKGAAKKEHILMAGIEVMKQQGYNGCSIKDIVEAAEVPKGSFYNYFASKEAFAIEAVEWVAHESCGSIENALQCNDIPPLERLIAFFDNASRCAAEADFKVGCFLGNMGQEMADSSDELRKVIYRSMNRHTAVIEQVVAELIHSQRLALDAKSTTEFIYCAWEGAIMRAKCSKSAKPFEAFLGMLKHLFK